MTDDITAITVNFKTPDLLKTCVATFRAHYPDLPYIVIDNGGCTESVAALNDLEEEHDLIVICNRRNVGHGPALNQGLALVETAYAFLLDSDTETKQGGFLEKMLALFEADDNLFAAGWLRWVNRETGVSYRSGPAGVAYIHPYACLLDMAKFRGLPPFIHHGAPGRDLMRGAQERGYEVADFPIGDYVWHKIGGTRGLFRGRVNVGTDEKPGEWQKLRI